MYDITNRKSFDNLEYWLNEIKDTSNSMISIALVGNKSDLAKKASINISDKD